MKVELSTASDIYESSSSAENSSHQISPEIDPLIPDGNIASPFDLIQLSNNEESYDHADSAANEKQKINNSTQHFISRWQVPKSQRNGRHNNQNGNFVKWEPAHKHREQKVNNGGKIWTKKFKPESGLKSRVHNGTNNQTEKNSCQLLIGSISVTVRNSTSDQQVNHSAVEFQENGNTENKTKGGKNSPSRSNPQLGRNRHENIGQSIDSSKSQMLEEDMTSARGVEQTLTTESSHQSLDLNGNDSEDANVSNVQVEGGDKLMHFSIDAAKDFLSQSMLYLLHPFLLIPCFFYIDFSHQLFLYKRLLHVMSSTEIGVGNALNKNVSIRFMFYL